MKGVQSTSIVQKSVALRQLQTNKFKMIEAESAGAYTSMAFAALGGLWLLLAPLASVSVMISRVVGHTYCEVCVVSCIFFPNIVISKLWKTGGRRMRYDMIAMCWLFAV